jgi:hypothetical protein
MSGTEDTEDATTQEAEGIELATTSLLERDISTIDTIKVAATGIMSLLVLIVKLLDERLQREKS